jgi:hypothetical protein
MVEPPEQMGQGQVLQLVARRLMVVLQEVLVDLVLHVSTWVVQVTKEFQITSVALFRNMVEVAAVALVQMAQQPLLQQVQQVVVVRVGMRFQQASTLQELMEPMVAVAAAAADLQLAQA